MSSDSHGLPGPYAAVVAFALALVVAGVLVILLVRARRDPGPRRGRLLTVSSLAVGLVAVGVFLGGLSWLLVMDEGIADDRCLAALSPEEATTRVGYDVGFLPLRFACRLRDGHEVATSIPGFVNPTLLVLTCGAVLLWGAGRAESEPL